MKITNESNFEIIHFDGDSLRSYNAIKVDGKWCAGVNEDGLRLSDEQGFAARFANEHTASEYIKHIVAISEKVALGAVEVNLP